MLIEPDRRTTVANRGASWLRSFACAALILAGAMAPTQDSGFVSKITSSPKPLDQFIVYKDRAFIVGDPILALGPRVLSGTWSQDGQYVLVRRALTSEKLADVLADSSSQSTSWEALSILEPASLRNTEVTRFDPSRTSLQSMGWFPGTDRVLAVTASADNSVDARPNEVSYDILIASGPGGNVQRIAPWLGMSPTSVWAMPSSSIPLALILMSFPGAEIGRVGSRPMMQPESYSLAILSSSGDIRSIKLENPTAVTSIAWSGDGKTPYVSQQAEGGVRWQRIDLQTGSLIDSSPEGARLTTGFKSVNDKFQIREIDLTLANGKSIRRTTALWLESKDTDGQNRVLLSGDARHGAISPRLDSVSYIAQGSLIIRPMVEVPTKLFEEIARMTDRNQAMSEVRHIGLALLMYAADNEDELPKNGTDVIALLADYIRDPSLGGRFVYTFAGGSIVSNVAPATVTLGYIEIDGGRVVTFMDGHVEFVPNQPVN